MYTYDLNNHVWEKIEYSEKSKPPEPRGGHSMYTAGSYIYIYGGWNHEYQFENFFHFNVETNDWWEPDTGGQTIPLWNHSAILVQAIPSAKYFIFGGESANFPEGGPRGFGEF